MTDAAAIRSRAEALASALPPLLADAEHLAATVLLGSHGRRRAGMGDEFWQYRPARAGDEARQIDWRRSARSDAHFVREKEWQAAQSVLIWVDDAKSMEFVSAKGLARKSECAALLALAAAILLERGGERIGLDRLGTPPRSGALQILRIAQALAASSGEAEYGAPRIHGMLPHSRALFVSDFLGDLDPVTEQLTAAADRGVKGALVMVLDPQEESFPFSGRTIFESMGRTLAHETMKASELRDRYLERLAARKDALAQLSRRTGWQFHCHHTDQPAQSALLWIYGALERRR